MQPANLEFALQVMDNLLRQEDSITQISDKFAVGGDNVYYWIDHGVVNAEKVEPGCPWGITLDNEKCKEPNAWAKNSGHLNRNKIRQI